MEKLPKLIDVRCGYHFWLVAHDNGKPVYNVTTGALPYRVESGYYYLAHLYRLKGVQGMMGESA